MAFSSSFVKPNYVVAGARVERCESKNMRISKTIPSQSRLISLSLRNISSIGPTANGMANPAVFVRHESLPYSRPSL
jgi:hypothetical protein